MMSGSASKNKGKIGERELSKIFQKTFGGSWIRTFTSGAYTGGVNKFRSQILSESQLLNQSNDIVAPDEFPNVAIECKFYKDFDFHHLFRVEGNAILNDWINQVENSGIDMKKAFPMICFKINRKGWFCCLWENKLQKYNFKNIQHFYYCKDDKNFVICELEALLKDFKEELIESFQ